MGNLVSRREFLKFTGGVAAGAAALPTNAEAATGRRCRQHGVAVQGQGRRQGRLAWRQSGRDLHFPGRVVALRAGEDGQRRSPAASVPIRTSSPTARCARTWAVRSRTTPAQKVFKCPCHFSMFDAEKGGQMICGQATENLPRIVLQVQRQGRLRDRGCHRRPALRPSVQHSLEGTEIMASKDRVALPPVNAQKTNLTCHFCIVGCGYHVYKWDENTEGGRAPHQNALGLDFRKQLPPLATIMTPGDDQRHHGQGRQALQHHDRAGQGVLGEPGTVVDARRPARDGDVHRRRRRQGAAAHSARATPATSGSTRAGTTRSRSMPVSPRRSSTPTGRADSSSTASTTAAPAAASRTLGHRQADVHGAEDADGAHPQPPGVQLRVPRDARDGHRRAQQQLRGCRSSPTSSWRSAATPTRRRPTTSSRTGCRTCRAGRSTRRRSGSRARRSPRPRSSSSIRAARPTIAICRVGRRQGQRAAPRHRAGDRHRALQRPVHLRRRPGLARQGLHRQVHERLRRRGAGQQALARRGEPHHRRSRSRSSGRPPSGPTSRRPAGSARTRCTPTRRASSGATTTT